MSESESEPDTEPPRPCACSTDPTITATLFRVPQCLQLGDFEYHEEDYTINCASAEFYFVATLAVGLILAIPVGVPLGFLFLMNRARERLPGGQVNSTLLGGAKLVPNDKDDVEDRFGFLCRDCKPEYWYYEVRAASHPCNYIQSWIEVFRRHFCLLWDR